MDDQQTNRREQGSISEEVLATLRQIIRAIDVHSKQLSKHFGLTGPQLVLIKEIGAHQDITVSQLARKVSLSQATVTTIIDRLETRGLATRIRSARDKRKVTLRITPKAQEILEANPTFLQEEFIRNFERLEKWEQTQILSSIQRLARMMKAEQFESHPVLSTQELPEQSTAGDHSP